MRLNHASIHVFHNNTPFSKCVTKYISVLCKSEVILNRWGPKWIYIQTLSSDLQHQIYSKFVERCKDKLLHYAFTLCMECTVLDKVCHFNQSKKILVKFL